MKTADVSTIPPQDPARRAWVLYHLALRGYTYASLGREIGAPRTTVRAAVRKPYPAIERVIAAKLGLRPEQIWPERYDARGRPRRKRPLKPSKYDPHAGAAGAANSAA